MEQEFVFGECCRINECGPPQRPRAIDREELFSTVNFGQFDRTIARLGGRRVVLPGLSARRRRRSGDDSHNLSPPYRNRITD